SDALRSDIAATTRPREPPLPQSHREVHPPAFNAHGLHVCHNLAIGHSRAGFGHSPPLPGWSAFTMGSPMQESSVKCLSRPSTPIAARVVDLCIRRRWWVVALAMVLLVLSGIYGATHFAINTNTDRLIASDVPWRQREIAFDALFPWRVGLTAVVVDADTAE